MRNHAKMQGKITMSELEIVNREHYDECINFAKSKGDNSLEKCINTLKEMANGYNAVQTKLFRDFAAYSFVFSIRNSEKEVLRGGIIYHGAHDNGGDGGAPTFSVNANPVDGWTIHT